MNYTEGANPKKIPDGQHFLNIQGLRRWRLLFNSLDHVKQATGHHIGVNCICVDRGTKLCEQYMMTEEDGWGQPSSSREAVHLFKQVKTQGPGKTKIKCRKHDVCRDNTKGISTGHAMHAGACCT